MRDSSESEHPQDAVAVFFYGLFMDAEALRARGCAVHSVQPASLHGFAFRLGRRATLVPDAGSVVPGMVMLLDSFALDALYAESSVSAYRPITTTAKADDGAVLTVRCYVLPESQESDRPDAEYAARLCALLVRLGLPTQHVTEALARSPAAAKISPEGRA